MWNRALPYSQAIWQFTGYLKLLKYFRIRNLKAKEGVCMTTYIWSHHWLRNNSGDFSVMLLLSMILLYFYSWALAERICLSHLAAETLGSVSEAGSGRWQIPKGTSSTRLMPHWARSDPTWPPPDCLISLLNVMLWSQDAILNWEIPKAELYPIYSVGASWQAFLTSFFHKTGRGFLTRSANHDLQDYWYINVKHGLWLRREIFSSETCGNSLTIIRYPVLKPQVILKDACV